MNKKELPKFLQEIQQEIMIDMRKKGHSLQNIASVFNTSKMIVYRLTGERFSKNENIETNTDSRKV